MTEIAKAYVQIIPSMEGFNTKIKNTVESEAGEAGKSSGGFFSNMFAQTSQGGLKGFVSAAGSAMAGLGKSALEGVAKLGSMAVSVHNLYKSCYHLVPNQNSILFIQLSHRDS